MDLDQYKTQTRPSHRRSKLDPHTKDIRALLGDGYSYAQVVDWLATIGLSISKQSLGDWLHRRSRNTPSTTDPMPQPAPHPAAQPPDPTLSNTPATVDKIFGQPVNLDHYANIKKRTPK